MRFARLVLPMLLGCQMPSPLAAQEPEIIVRGDVAQIEIERILDADNLDASRLSPREVADAMAEIPRGRAPEDFWIAYRAHVEAWRRLADATDAARRSRGRAELDAVETAEDAIDSSFDEVERIARRYGARLPVPVWQRLPTV